MLAAEAIYASLKAGSNDLSSYETAVYDSQIGKDLWQTRNMKQPFGRGLIVGGAITNAMVVTKGRFPGGHWATHRDADQPLLLTDRHERYPKPDGKYTFDKLSGVFLTGNATRDDAPSHIRVQQRVPYEVAEAWQRMCPAQVYEIPEDAREDGFVDLIVNPSNCVQCGAITAKGGRLTPPEGGDGPMYQRT
jgi:electron-transferring-flavoprotein dehydrogenase